MSKRFGRNQKRAMRATILEQATELRSADKRISELKNAQRPMREALDEAVRVLGPNFIGLPVTARQVDVIAHNYRVPAHVAMQNYLPMVSNGEVASLVSCAVYELENHRVDGALDKLRNQVHFYLQTGRGECAYSISPDDIHQLGWKRLADIYTPMIAEAFARLVCDEKGGRRG